MLRHLENRVVSEDELRRYLNTESLNDLLLTLRYLEREGYFNAEVMLSAKYRSWARDRHRLLLQADALNPPDPFGVMRQAIYGLSVECEAPLTRAEVNEVIRALSNDMAERYLQFKLSNINQEKLLDYVEMGVKSRGADKDEFYGRVEYRGLVVNGPKVTFNGEPIKMGLQHRQALRIFIDKEGRVCSYEDFTDDSAGIFTRKSYPNLKHTVRNLIYELRKALEAATEKVVIENSNSDGWCLNIKP